MEEEMLKRLKRLRDAYEKEVQNACQKGLGSFITESNEYLADLEKTWGIEIPFSTLSILERGGGIKVIDDVSPRDRSFRSNMDIPNIPFDLYGYGHEIEVKDAKGKYTVIVIAIPAEGR